MKNAMGIKEPWIFKSPVSHFSQLGRGLKELGVGVTAVAANLIDYFSGIISRIQNSDHKSTDPCYLEDRALFVHAWSTKLLLSCSKNTCTAACWGQEMGTWHCAKMKLTAMSAVYLSKSFLESCKPPTDSRVPK